MVFFAKKSIFGVSLCLLLVQCAGYISPLNGASGNSGQSTAVTELAYAATNVALDVNTNMDVLQPSFKASSAAKFSVSPDLPQGLSLNASTGAISGKPTRLALAQTFHVTLQDGSLQSIFDLVLSVNYRGFLVTSKVQPGNDPGTIYQGRMVYNAKRKSILLYGGSTSGNSINPVNAMWELKNNVWSAICVGNCAPGPRARHGLVYDDVRDRVLLIGGVSDSGGSTPADMWQWKDGVWSKVQVDGHDLTLPSELNFGFGAAYDKKRDRVVTFGGRGASGRSPYIYEFDGLNWSDALHPTPRPSARAENALQTFAFDEHRGLVVLYGGEGASGALNDDTWTWNGVSWTQICDSCTGHPRRLSTLVYDSARDAMVLMNGWDNSSEISETWEFKDFQWQQNNALGGQVPGRDGMFSVYNADTQSVFVYGGNGPQCGGDCAETYEYHLPR